MTLKDFVRFCVKDELEVWDQYVDIKQPVYCYPEETYGEDEPYLSKMADWFSSLEISNYNKGVVNVDVYHEIEKNWKTILIGMNENGGYTDFLMRWNKDIMDDEAIAEYVEDVFTILACGYEENAKDFCQFMGLC